MKMKVEPIITGMLETIPEFFGEEKKGGGE